MMQAVAKMSIMEEMLVAPVAKFVAFETKKKGIKVTQQLVKRIKTFDTQSFAPTWEKIDLFGGKWQKSIVHRVFNQIVV